MQDRTICVRVGWSVQWVNFPDAWQQKIDRVESNGNLYYTLRLPPGANVDLEKRSESKTFVITLKSVAKPAE
jgi:hypothetical protein